MIIDFHTHAFPDKIANFAISKLSEHSGDYSALTDGTVAGLLKIMDSSKIDISVVQNIATRPEQTKNIVHWSQEISNERIISFASIHPDSPTIENDIALVKNSHLKGIKLHPMYQNFAVDEKKMFPVYEMLQHLEIPVLFHAGNDIAFPGSDLAAPSRFSNVLENFPRFKIVAAHLGGWEDWEEVDRYLAGKEIIFDTSFIDTIKPYTLESILKKHSHHCLVFGSDLPWWHPDKQIKFINQLKIPRQSKELIFYKTAKELLCL